MNPRLEDTTTPRARSGCGHSSVSLSRCVYGFAQNQHVRLSWFVKHGVHEGLDDENSQARLGEPRQIGYRPPAQVEAGTEIYHPHRHRRLCELDLDANRAQTLIAIAMDDDVVERLADRGDEMHPELAPALVVSS